MANDKLASVQHQPFKYTKFLTILSDSTFLFIGYDAFEDDCVFIRTTAPRVDLHTILEVRENVMDYVNRNLFKSS
jgi:hypothetical protein